MKRLTVHVYRQDILPEHLHLQATRPDIDVVIKEAAVEPQFRSLSLQDMADMFEGHQVSPKLAICRLIREMGGKSYGGYNIGLKEAVDWYKAHIDVTKSVDWYEALADATK